MSLKKILEAANELKDPIAKFWNACTDHGFDLYQADDFLNAVMAHMSKYGWGTEISKFSDIISLAFKVTQ